MLTITASTAIFSSKTAVYAKLTADLELWSQTYISHAFQRFRMATYTYSGFARGAHRWARWECDGSIRTWLNRFFFQGYGCFENPSSSVVFVPPVKDINLHRFQFNSSVYRIRDKLTEARQAILVIGLYFWLASITCHCCGSLLYPYLRRPRVPDIQRMSSMTCSSKERIKSE